MPEGHHLHRLAAALDEAFAGTTPEVSSPQGRFTGGAALLDGHPVVEAFAAGKHLFVEFAGAAYLHVHLGLIGQFDITPLVAPDTVPPAVGAVRVRLRNEGYVADLRGRPCARPRPLGTSSRSSGGSARTRSGPASTRRRPGRG